MFLCGSDSLKDMPADQRSRPRPTDRLRRAQATEACALVNKDTSFDAEFLLDGLFAKLARKLCRESRRIDCVHERALVFGAQLEGPGEFLLQLLILFADRSAGVHERP
jgi:hypothetical protein